MEQQGGLRSGLVWTCKRLSPRFSGVLFSDVCTAHEGLELIRKLDCFQGHQGPRVSHWLIFSITQRDKSYMIPFILVILNSQTCRSREWHGGCQGLEGGGNGEVMAKGCRVTVMQDK